jgi:hypothetical protein
MPKTGSGGRSLMGADENMRSSLARNGGWDGSGVNDSVRHGWSMSCEQETKNRPETDS